jgi:glycosyltransferase involved in cell wall biosynthesis
MSSDRARYVIVSQRYPPEKGGNASRIHDTAVNLTDESTAVTVLSPPPCYPPGNFPMSWQRCTRRDDEGVTVRRLWSWQPRRENPGLLSRSLYYLVFALHAAIWILSNHRRIDAVITSTPPITTGIPGFASALLGVPWVVDVRDLWIENSVALGYISEDSALVCASRRFQRLVLWTADRVTVTTQNLGEAICETYGEQLESKIRHIPNGVDCDLFGPTDIGSETPVRSGSGPTVVYTGNIGSAQALEPCIRAMEHVSRDDVELLLVGDGDERSRLREVTRELDLDETVRFAGLIDRAEVPAVISDAAVGLAPLQSTGELAYAMPTKVYEYLACRVPVVVTGRGEIRRFVADSGGGVHAETDPEAIAAAIETALADRERENSMGTAGYQYVRSNYDRGQIADSLREELAALTE